MFTSLENILRGKILFFQAGKGKAEQFESQWQEMVRITIKGP